jgi:hypothetical protein
VGTDLGTPSNIVTGNTHKHDTDIRSLGAGLSLGFQRHYNSQTAHKPTLVGYGWRHSYQMNSVFHKTGEVSIVQPDGRRLVFEPTDEENRYEGRLASDGCSPPPRRSSTRLSGIVTMATATTLVKTAF